MATLRSTFVTPAVFAAALVSALLLTCAPPADAATTGSGRAASEVRAVAGFDAISVSGAIDVVVRASGREGVEVSADDNLLPLVETVVEDRRLLVRVRRGESLRTRSPVVVTVDVVQIGRLALAGAGNARVLPLAVPSFELAIAGSGDALLERIETTGTLTVSVSGSGDVRGSGRAGAVRVRIAGSGDVDLGAVVAEEARVTIAGSGDADVHASRTAEATIAGSGDVIVRGQPAALKSRVAGSGDVIRR